MSNFKQYTRHPRTGEWHMAEWLDDYYGPHRYAVRFGHGTPEEAIYKADDLNWSTRSVNPETFVMNTARQDLVSFMANHESHDINNINRMLNEFDAEAQRSALELSCERKCTNCWDVATQRTVKGEDNEKHGGLPINDGWYCEKCYDEGLAEENEAMHGS